jgi:hypothetical protein
VADAWRTRGTSRGVPADRRPAGNDPKPVGARDMRTQGEGGDDADERGSSGSGRGREGRGTDRRDQPVSGRGRHGGCGLRGARVGAREPAREAKGELNPDE